MMHKGEVVHTDDVTRQLREKIPQSVPAPEMKRPAAPADAPVQIVTADEYLRKFIRNFASKGAAPGPLQLSGRVVSVVVESKVGLDAVAAILTDLTNGTFSDAMRPWFLGSVGAAIPKPGGDIRPICVGDVFYRLAASRLVQRNISKIRKACGKHQLGQGVRSGCEAIVHFLQAVLETPSGNVAALKIDIKNAFNTRSCVHALTTLFAKPELKELWRMTAWSYAKPSPVWFLEQGQIILELLFMLGVKQGDPFGSVLFDLSIEEDLRKAAAMDPSVTVLAMHDDAYLVGPPDRIRAVFEKFRSTAAKRGSIVNVPKCELLWFQKGRLPSDVEEWLAEENIRLQTKAAVILGAPIGVDPVAVSDIALVIADTHTKFFERILHAGMPVQEGLYLLRLCGVPRWNYLVRCVRPNFMFNANRVFERMQIETFIIKAGIEQKELDDRLQQELSLPQKRFGGWGLRSPVQLSHIAWLSAQAAVAPIIQPLLQKFGMGDAEEKNDEEEKDERKRYDENKSEERARRSPRFEEKKAVHVEEKKSGARDVDGKDEKDEGKMKWKWKWKWCACWCYCRRGKRSTDRDS